MGLIFDNVKTNLERTIQNLSTNEDEFIYNDTGGKVPKDKVYSIYYTNDKRESFFTGILTNNYPRELIKTTNTSFSNYVNLKGTQREIYPDDFTSEITDDDYQSGIKTRYFAQLANDKTSPILEISESDFDKKLNLYNKTSVRWKISGTRQNVENTNTIIIKNTERNYPGFSQKVFPLQFWKPSKGSIDDIENKLSRLKK